MGTEMSSAEIDAFLDSQRTLVLVTLRGSGSPIAHAMWFARVGSNLYVNTQSDSLKCRNVAGDDRVCALVEAGEAYFELRGVRIEGRCQPVDDPGEVERVQAAQADKEERIGSGLEGLPGWFSGNRAERTGRGARTILRIPMDRVYSWDFSKAREHYAGSSKGRREGHES